MFYSLPQFNSGGRHIINDKIGRFIIIEAQTAAEARRRAYEITKDYMSYCPCCGERWDYDSLDDEGETFPNIWGEPINNRSARVYYLDGRIEKRGD